MKGTVGLVGLMLGASASLSCATSDDGSVTATAASGLSDNHAPWSFGVMSDLQWGAGRTDPTGKNTPSGGVTVTIFEQLAAQFIGKGVKFVVSVGDQINRSGNLAVAGAVALPLYEAGIGFFPVRGNHEASTTANMPGFIANFPQTREGQDHRCAASGFNSPNDFYQDGALAELDGFSYSFDYAAPGGSVRILMIDDWATPTRATSIPGLPGYVYGYTIAEQQGWISDRLSTRPAEQHAFVFAHHNLMPEYHYDALFTGFADSNPDAQNAFFASLVNNRVGSFISGHEHLHNRSIVTSPDGASSVQELICASAGSKLLEPKAPSDAGFHGQKIRQTELSQELHNIGYYIFTVDGARVTIDYYADRTGNFASDGKFPDGTGSLITPTLEFVKKESWGYSLNGKGFLIPQGASYRAITDSYAETTATVLSGTNDGANMDLWARPLSKYVTTGWSGEGPDTTFRSRILTLWGMPDFGNDETDVYTLQLTYEQGKTRHLGEGRFGIGTRDASGRWVNAVDTNFGGTKSFRMGAWDPSYGLGSYGVDPSTKTVWAVVNHGGDFAAKNEIEPQ